MRQQKKRFSSLLYTRVPLPVPKLKFMGCPNLFPESVYLLKYVINGMYFPQSWQHFLQLLVCFCEIFEGPENASSFVFYTRICVMLFQQ